MRIPASDNRFQPFNQLGRVLWVLSGQGPIHQNPLDGFGHVQPATAQWRVQWHDAVCHQPAHESSPLMTGQMIQNQQHP